MTNTEILLGVAAIVLPVLTYFAGVQRERQRRQEDIAQHEAELAEARQRELEAAKAQRIGDVVGRYRQLWAKRESSSLQGMLKAGVRSLESSAEVAEACRLIEREGMPPGIPHTYAAGLERADLLVFFQLVGPHASEVLDEPLMRELASQARQGRDPKAAL